MKIRFLAAGLLAAGGVVLFLKGAFPEGLPASPSPRAAGQKGFPQGPLPAVGPGPPLEVAVPPQPPLEELHEQAIRYAEVMPEKIHRWRAGAAFKGWLPKLTLSLDRDLDRTIASSASAGRTTFSVGPEDQSVSVGVNFSWDLRDLLWSSDQISIDVRSRLMVQMRREILEEATRLYFERSRLLTEFSANPTQDPQLIAERRIRGEELTGRLDALTGGWFSKVLKKHS